MVGLFMKGYNPRSFGQTPNKNSLVWKEAPQRLTALRGRFGR
jgi:hypothetical protein